MLLCVGYRRGGGAVCGIRGVQEGRRCSVCRV